MKEDPVRIRRNTERFMKFKTTKGFHKVNNVKE